MNSKMDDSLKSEDVGTLIREKADKLAKGEGDEDELYHDILETLGRSEDIRQRDKPVDGNGRISVGRDLSGIRGRTIFHADPDEPESVSEASRDA